MIHWLYCKDSQVPQKVEQRKYQNYIKEKNRAVYYIIIMPGNIENNSMIHIYINIVFAFCVKNEIFTFKSCVSFIMRSVNNGGITIIIVMQQIPFQSSQVLQ